MKTLGLLVAVILFCGLTAPEAAAQDETWKKDRFMFGLGFYRPNFDTKVQVGVDGGPSGTLLNLEKDLDLNDRKSQIILDMHFRFAKRHAI